MATRGRFPGFRDIENPPPAPDTGIAAIDHIVGNVELGHMDEWVGFYRDVMGFSQLTHFTDQAISTDYTALMSKVMQNGSGRIKFPINEPAEGKRRSQIDEYLTFYGGPGVQHIALATKDIVATVDALHAAGINFLHVPDSYYTELPSRVGPIDENVDGTRQARHSRGPRRRRLSAANFLAANAGPTDAVFRGDPPPRLQRLWRRQLQGAFRGDRARTGTPRKPLASPLRVAGCELRVGLK